jgi:hypothetical protein
MLGGSLDVPQRVGINSILVVRDLLLFESPLGEFHLAREEVAARIQVPKLEMRPQRPQALARLFFVAVALFNRDNLVVLDVADEASHAIR